MKGDTWSLDYSSCIVFWYAIWSLSLSYVRGVKDNQMIAPHKPYKGPSTQESCTCPKPVLQLVIPNSQVPNYWVHGPSGKGMLHPMLGEGISVLDSLYECGTWYFD